jgi:hypothetical protein
MYAPTFILHPTHHSHRLSSDLPSLGASCEASDFLAAYLSHRKGKLAQLAAFDSAL